MSPQTKPNYSILFPRQRAPASLADDSADPDCLPTNAARAGIFRFTRDGSPELEGFLAGLAEQVLQQTRECVGEPKLEALILAGGYGRGEGGVLKSSTGDQPYNDLEFYLFLRGHRVLNESKVGPRLHAVVERLSRSAGLDIDVKIDSLKEWRRRPVSMFSYDLAVRHHRLHGPANLFEGCEQHLDPRNIPPSEAVRLLLNRSSGLLLAKAMLVENAVGTHAAPELRRDPSRPRASLTSEQRDFIARNLAKMRLALGDALLAARGEYHWSCLERHSRLRRKSSNLEPPWFERVRELHAEAVEFKLHPVRSTQSVQELSAEHQEISNLAQEVWLWLESARLQTRFSTAREYALSAATKGLVGPVWRNLLLHFRMFGVKALLGRVARRYPRERLFNSLPLLLWCGDCLAEPEIRAHLQRQLTTDAADWAAFLQGYTSIWRKYG